MEALHHSGGIVTIVPATLALLEQEEQGGDRLAKALGVAAPLTWPPEHMDAGTRDWIRGLLGDHPDEPGFASWYVIAAGELVGSAGFKGPPDAAGEVEIGYSIIAPWQRRGYASAAVDLLVGYAFGDPRVTSVRAETLVDGVASQKVLRHCGFLPDGTRVDAGGSEIACFRRKR